MTTHPADWLPWSGVLAVEGEPGADGRSIEPGRLVWPILPVPLIAMDGNEAIYTGRIEAIARIDGRLEARGRIGGVAAGTTLAVHVHIDAQGVRPADRGDDPRRIPGGAVVGARLADEPLWLEAVITVGAAGLA